MKAKQDQNLEGKLLGVEIEYYPSEYETNREADSLEVEVKCDGSLAQGGREVCAVTWTTRPDGRLMGLHGLKLSGRVDKSCGLHVHVDARHLGKNGLLDAAATYDKLMELSKHLKALCPPSRRSNKYCQWRNNRIGSATFERPSNGLRYAAINFEAFAEHGTIEFRCQAGSINVHKIEMWALLCQHLLNWCARPENTITWALNKFAGFLRILPQELRVWAYLREQKLSDPSSTVDWNRLAAASDAVVTAATSTTEGEQ